MSLDLFDVKTLDHLKLFASCLIFVGFILTAFQINAARRQARANVLLKLIDEWNNRDLYESVRYIHRLRREWKTISPDGSNWEALAREWVENNVPKDSNPAPDNWMKRRRASQFLSKMGYMVKAGYLTRDDLFTTVPEARRLLIVLSPIEREIVRLHSNEEPLASWDKPFDKMFFDYVQTEFDRWHEDQKLARL